MILCFFQVRGLSFGYRSNTLLASGGSHGRVLVWDLNDLSKDEIPTFEVLLMFWYHRSAMVITTLKLLEFYIRLRKDNTVAVLRLVFSVA